MTEVGGTDVTSADVSVATAPDATAPGTTEPVDIEPAGSAPRGARSAGRTVVEIAAVTAVLAVPVVIAAVAVRTPRWYPLVDLAQIEMRVRDVGTSHPPVLGPIGRFFGLGTQGSHPGAISFWLLAPVYRALGSSSWALQVSAAMLNTAALAATVWAAHRRGGLRTALVVGAALALFMRICGTTVLVYPWNPYFCVLFWALFVVCVWGILDDDVVLVPVAVLAGTVCVQSHVSYAVLVGGLGVLAAGALVATDRRSRDDPALRRRLRRWTGGGVALAALLWLPVLAEEVRGDPGNLSVITDSFRNPVDEPVGFATGTRLLLEHLDPIRLLAGDRLETRASAVVGGALLVVWAVAAAAAVRRRDPALVRLHALVAATLALGVVAISRILGVPWFYLTLWAYGVTALVMVATAATAAVVIGGGARSAGGGRSVVPPGVVLAALGLAMVLPTALLARSAPGTEDSDAELSAQLGRVVGPTVDAIEDGRVGGGEDATYFVSWDDQNDLGGKGFGLLLELERRGYAVRAPEAVRLSVRDHRVAAPEDSDAVIHLASGVAAIERAEAREDAREIAFHDPRSRADIAEYARLRTDVMEGLAQAGLDDLVAQVDENLFALGHDERLPVGLRRSVDAMWQIPRPLAVYTWDADA